MGFWGKIVKFTQNLLICCSGPKHKNNVEAGQTNDRDGKEGTKGHEDDGGEIWPGEDVAPAEQCVAEGKTEHADHVQAQEDQKQEEVAIIAFANAVVNLKIKY